MEVILVMVLLVLVIWLSIKLVKVLWKVAIFLLALVGLVLLGPAALVGYVFSAGLKLLRLQKPGVVLASVVGVSLPFVLAYLNGHQFYDVLNFEYGKYLAILPFFLLFVPAFNKLVVAGGQGSNEEFILKKKDEVLNYVFIGLSFTLVTSVAWHTYLPETVAVYYAEYLADYSAWITAGYWLIGLFLVLIGFVLAYEVAELTELALTLISSSKQNKYADLEKIIVSKASVLDEKDAKLLFNSVVVARVLEGKIVEVEMEDGSSLINDAEFFEKAIGSIEAMTDSQDRLDLSAVAKVVAGKLSLNEKDALFFSQTHLNNGEFRFFEDGEYFVSYKNTSVLICACCGKAQIENSCNDEVWYCSDICIETEDFCDNLKKQDLAKFLNSAKDTGLLLVAASDAYVENHKTFAAGSQGHGFAAENANNMIDKIKGKNASVIGGDNAKNGADRIVDGQLLQTKYCATAARSVGAGFDGRDGNYRYLTPDGKPMALEVPKDQYAKAIDVMKGKIKAGKVPGVSNPADAEKLIVKGGVTYEQARNITRFGTVESVTYDVAEGAVVGLSAAGISFGVVVATCFLQDKDKSAALRAGLVQGAKSWGKTTSVFVGAQQLHRLGVVQSTLKHIDIEHLSPSLRNFIQNGSGQGSVRHANSALRGTLLTTVVVIAITTGPDLFKLARGRISSGQFVKNLTVVSSGAIGGVAGSIAGGALLSPLGPVGLMAGRVVGGMVGTAITTFAAKHLTDKLIEDDRDAILIILTNQMRYLVSVFMLTESEVDNLNKNLQKVLTNSVIEKIFASKGNRIAAANMVVKPIVVGIVKQRPQINYSQSDIESTAAELVKVRKLPKVA